MQVRTRHEIEALKRNWLEDGCWDLEKTEGFEAHHDELLAFSTEAARQANERLQVEEARIDAEADKLDVRGLYRLMLRMQREIGALDERLEHVDGPLSLARN